MAKIEAFKAVIYNQEKIKDVSFVLCPPYDIISPAKQQYYHDLNQYNLAHLLLGKDTSGEDKYKRAGSSFKEWLKDKILIQDTRPAIYFYSQQYNIKGEKKARLGFISLLHLDNKDSSTFGHEHTRLEPKEDRLRLLKQVRANLSPIFVIFLDKKRIIQRTYQKYIIGKTPFLDATDDEKVIHKLWRLDSPEILAGIKQSMSGENIFIADGHHRYEVACAFRDAMKEKLKDKFSGEESFNYTMSYFTNTDARGLTILPIHRLVRLGPDFSGKAFFNRLSEYFDIEEVREKNRFFFLMEKGGRTEHVLGMYKDKNYWLLRLKNIKILDRTISDKPKAYRSLDISILNTLILKKILGLDIEDKENLRFSSWPDELIEEAAGNASSVVFFLNPVNIQQIISVASAGERMPSKSTYFYPKVCSGLVINKHD